MVANIVVDGCSVQVKKVCCISIMEVRIHCVGERRSHLNIGSTSVPFGFMTDRFVELVKGFLEDIHLFDFELINFLVCVKQISFISVNKDA